MWPERLPLTMRLGSDDFHPDGITFEESITAIGWMKEHGLDLADISQGGNTDEMVNPIWNDPMAWVARAERLKREVDIPVTTSWNLGVPANADAAIRSGAVDLILLGRPALANPHWPVWAARELGTVEPFDLVPKDWGFWLQNFRGHGPSVGWPEVVDPEPTVVTIPQQASEMQSA